MSNSQAILAGMRLRKNAVPPLPTPNLLNGPRPGSPVPDEPHDWIPSGTEYFHCGVCGTRLYSGILRSDRWDEVLLLLNEAGGATCAAAIVVEVMRS